MSGSLAPSGSPSTHPHGQHRPAPVDTRLDCPAAAPAEAPAIVRNTVVLPISVRPAQYQRLTRAHGKADARQHRHATACHRQIGNLQLHLPRLADLHAPRKQHVSRPGRSGLRQYGALPTRAHCRSVPPQGCPLPRHLPPPRVQRRPQRRVRVRNRLAHPQQQHINPPDQRHQRRSIRPASPMRAPSGATITAPSST